MNPIFVNFVTLKQTLQIYGLFQIISCRELGHVHVKHSSVTFQKV